MEDLIIIDLMFSRDESALTELSKKYSSMYKRVIRNSLSDERDVEECENDLLLALWNNIPPHRPKSLPAYVCTLARRIGIDKLKYNTRKKRSSDYTVMLSELAETVPSDEGGEISDSHRITEILDEFLGALDKESRVLFVRRYICLDSVKDIADRFSLSESYVGVKLFRARKKLKKMLQKEGVVI